jgi:uncharacterized protein YxeA
MRRSLSTALAAALLSASLFAAPSQAADDNKCTIATKDAGSEVGKACKEGGIKKAKTVMKAMQKKGKDKGVKFDCDDCHKDEANANWTLNADAQDKFKKLLAAIK